ASAYVAPIAHHPQGQQGWCSIIGGRTYRGPTYWRIEGKHIYTDYCGGHFYAIGRDEFGAWVRQQVMGGSITGWTVIGENSAGELFACTDSQGRLYSIKEQCVEPAPVISEDGDGLASTPAAAYQWYIGGTPISGATEQWHTPAQSGAYRVLATTQDGCQLFSNTIEFVTTGLAGNGRGAITVRPIPVEGTIWIDGIEAAGTRVELLDAQGRQARSAYASATGTMAVDVSGLATGVYTLRLTASDGHVLLRQPLPLSR
ncbi:MAG: T9SS type A sorting domain-containing protein, partial [Flavobacteriales bacterium]